MVPARVLWDYGADFVIACNSVPGPEKGNPFEDYLLGRIAYRLPVVGRLIDGWVTGAFFLQTVSKESARDAQIYVEPLAEDFPLVEMVCFADGARIESKAETWAGERATACRNRWREFAGLP